MLERRSLILILPILLGLIWLTAKNDYIFTTANILAINIIAVTGLNILIGATGQVSIGHAAFMGIVAYLSAILSSTYSVPIWLSCSLSLLVVSLIALLIAIPTLRLEGNYLVMATLGFNIVVQIIMNQWESVTGGPSGFSGIPRLSLGKFHIENDRQFFLIVWSIAIFLIWITINLERTKIGRAFRAIRANKVASEASGVPVHSYRSLAFVISAIYAGIAGVLYAHYMTFISPKTFGILTSLQWLTMSVLGGMGDVWGGILGTAFLTLLPEFLHKLEDLHILFYGSILMGTLIFCPEGLVPALKKLSKRTETQQSLIFNDDDRIAMSNKKEKILPSSGYSNALLKLEQVSLNFGGLRVLHNITLEFPSKGIHAIIGPNGAGKTTLLNVICAMVEAKEGNIKLLENGKVLSINRESTHIIAQKIGRTFQVSQIFHGMTVLEHVLIGMHKDIQENVVAGMMMLPSFQKKIRVYEEEALSLLDMFGLRQKAFVCAETLSLFEHKLLEIARAIAGRPVFILLDEPAGGLSSMEKSDISWLITQIARCGIGVVLIDHHMDLVSSLANRVVVLHQGMVIADGSPTEIFNNSEVIEAYLGHQKKALVFPVPPSSILRCASGAGELK
ncbi:MAG: ATP-binding cassette domain-containing protein [Thermodesulforhabdaceae bacterium]